MCKLLMPEVTVDQCWAVTPQISHLKFFPKIHSPLCMPFYPSRHLVNTVYSYTKKPLHSSFKGFFPLESKRASGTVYLNCLCRTGQKIIFFKQTCTVLLFM